MNVRRLSLKREVLQELSANDLVVVGGAAASVGRVCVADTLYSCMTFISCAMLHTCWAPETLLCINGE